MTKLVNTADAAQYLGVSKAFLERDRWSGAKIPFVRVGSRSVRYQITELEHYVNSRTLGPKADNSTPQW